MLKVHWSINGYRAEEEQNVHLWICSGIYAHVHTPTFMCVQPFTIFILWDLLPVRDCSQEGSSGHQAMPGLCQILWLLILKLLIGIISSAFKASLNHTSWDQLWGILLATSQTENYIPQIDHRRDCDEEWWYISHIYAIREDFSKVTSKAKE